MVFFEKNRQQDEYNCSIQSQMESIHRLVLAPDDTAHACMQHAYAPSPLFLSEWKWTNGNILVIKLLSKGGGDGGGGGGGRGKGNTGPKAAIH